MAKTEVPTKNRIYELICVRAFKTLAKAFYMKLVIFVLYAVTPS
jgi:hypothetical protein